MIYSERTYELVAQATVSALKDVISQLLNAEQLQQHMELTRRATDRSVDASQARDMLRRALQKHEADSVVEAYNSADTVNMTTGNSMWRLSNAISWVAREPDDAERKLEISKLAGQVLPQPGMSSIGRGAPSLQLTACAILVQPQVQFMTSPDSATILDRLKFRDCRR